MHSTDTLDDGYFGSGRFLRNSIMRYGKENHIREILESFSSRSELRKREKEIVNEELINDDLCMNLACGGEGGWEYINKNKLSPMFDSNHPGRKGVIEALRRGRKHPSRKSKCILNLKGGTKGKRLSVETCEKISKSQLGEKNSQFGSKLMYNPQTHTSKRVKASDVLLHQEQGWKFGYRKYTISNDELIRHGRVIISNVGKLTKQLWIRYARSKRLPRNMAGYFGSFQAFKEICFIR